MTSARSLRVRVNRILAGVGITAFEVTESVLMKNFGAVLTMGNKESQWCPRAVDVGFISNVSEFMIDLPPLTNRAWKGGER